MVELFLGYFLVHWGVMVIAYKYNISNKIKGVAKRFNSKFVYELSECEFCMEHHLGLLLVVPIFVIDLDLRFLIFAFMSASFMNIIKKISR